MTQDLTTSPEDDDAVSPEVERHLRAEEVVNAINAYAGPAGLTLIPKGYKFRKPDREAVKTGIHAAFELIGGLPAFTHWAASNPTQFYTGIWAKLAQAETAATGNSTFIYNTSLPSNPLDLVNVSQDGFVIQESIELPE